MLMDHPILTIGKAPYELPQACRIIGRPECLMAYLYGRIDRRWELAKVVFWSKLMNHLQDAQTWLNQEFKPYPVNTNEERHSLERDAVQQAQAHALISIAESLERLSDNDRSEDMVEELGKIRARLA